jgi:hypothetical protein
MNAAGLLRCKMQSVATNFREIPGMAAVVAVSSEQERRKSILRRATSR